MYIFEGKDNLASIINSEDSLSEEQKEKGIYISNLPTKEIIQGKTAILKADKAKELVWWEYIEIQNPPPIVTEILISKAEFLKRLTEEELNRCINYEFFTTGEDKLQKDMYMKMLWKLFDNFEKITISDAEWCQQFAQVIAWCELITTERLKTILEV